MAAALLVAAEREDRRPEYVEPDDRDPLGRARGRHLLVDDDLLDRRAAAAAELGGPGTADVARVVAAGLPAAEVRDPLVELVRKIRGIGTVLGEELAHLVAKCALLRFESELHRSSSSGTTRASVSTMPRQRARIVSL